MEREYPQLDVSRLKRRELDLLVDLFTLWSREPIEEEEEEEEDGDKEEDPIKAEMTAFWDARLRQLLKDRYDVKVSQGIISLIKMQCAVLCLILRMACLKWTINCGWWSAAEQPSHTRSTATGERRETHSICSTK